MPSPVTGQSQPTIALLPWGDLFEDFFDTIDVSFEKFGRELTGSWQFGYIDALQLAGVQTVLFYVSAQVSQTLRFVHEPTGARVCVLPASRLHRAARTLTFIPGMRTLSAYFSTPLRQLAQELHREDCQAILCQEYEYARFDTCVLLGRWLKLPVFATFQGGNKPLSWLEYPLRSLAMRTCAGLIIAAQTELQRVQTAYGLPKSKLAQIFNPLDVTTMRGGDRQQARIALNLPMEAQIIVWHGRVEIERKGLDILLEAWEQLCQQSNRELPHLLLVGTGSDAEVLHQQIAERQLANIIWIDQFINDRSLIQQYLSAADIYVLPSRHEGFPVAPVEAMACGLPIVAADAPGVADILEHGEMSGGIRVAREDAESLALALGQLLDNAALRQELGKRARHRVEQSFSLEIIGQQLKTFILSQPSSSTNAPQSKEHLEIH